VCEGLRRCKRKGKLAEEVITHEPSPFGKSGWTVAGLRWGGVGSLCLYVLTFSVLGYGRAEGWDEQTRKGGGRDGGAEE
jgi:hypothetical protein